jgi:hypothetical protein
MRRSYSSLRSYRPEVDTKPVDGWTIVHFGVGVAAGVVGLPMLITLAVALFWEAFENWRRPYRTLDWVPDWTPEVNTNILIDIVAALGGWGFGAALASRMA